MNKTDAQIAYGRINPLALMWRPPILSSVSEKRKQQVRNRAIRSLGHQENLWMWSRK